ncbi:MAG: hypothetical protein ACXABY_26010, partial [Candidatus Thorarchaeota archaeon]
LVAGKGLEPFSLAYETMLEPLQSNPHYLAPVVGVEPTAIWFGISSTTTRSQAHVGSGSRCRT